MHYSACTSILLPMKNLRLITLAIALTLSVAACDTATTTESGVRLITADAGASIQEAPPSDMVILDVRTPEEFSEGHLAGAILVDFYEADFADRIAELDPDVPYLLYCRSGNRSGETSKMMEDLGFTDVAEIDGGIVSWIDSGLPLFTQ